MQGEIGGNQRHLRGSCTSKPPNFIFYDSCAHVGQQCRVLGLPFAQINIAREEMRMARLDQRNQRQGAVRLGG